MWQVPPATTNPQATDDRQHEPSRARPCGRERVGDLWAVIGDRAHGVVRSITFLTLVTGNLALILVNRSWRLSIGQSLRHRTNPTIRWILLGATAPVGPSSRPRAASHLQLGPIGPTEWIVATPNIGSRYRVGSPYTDRMADVRLPVCVRTFAAVRLRVLHRAAEGGMHGAWMAAELARHGYSISPGTLYPPLHRTEGEGLLHATSEVVAGRARRAYRITPTGRRALHATKRLLADLADEILDR